MFQDLRVKVYKNPALFEHVIFSRVLNTDLGETARTKEIGQ